MHIYVSWGGGGGRTCAALLFPIWNNIFIYLFIYLLFIKMRRPKAIFERTNSRHTHVRYAQHNYTEM